MIQEPFPPLSGSYALRLALTEPVTLTVGRLGMVCFPAGTYLYLGSAHGPGGLRGRLRHHTHDAAHPHWHIDWLRQHARLVGGWYAVAEGQLECLWSQSLAELPGAAIPAPGFGASDCALGCRSHLLSFSNEIQPESIERVLRAITSGVTAF